MLIDDWQAAPAAPAAPLIAQLSLLLMLECCLELLHCWLGGITNHE